MSRARPRQLADGMDEHTAMLARSVNAAAVCQGTPVDRIAASSAPVSGAAPPDDVPKAAQYLRMSTDHQRYSIPYQRDAICTYARSRGVRIVRTYLDEGRSGLSLMGRSGLKALLSDVVTGNTDFELVLVYDVSRWGRFQDVDEGAFYEFLCRKEGITIEYCMEPFRNDGSALSSLVKNIKRMMAGEYSREMGERVYRAKHRAVKAGRWPGSPPGYGYRRMLIDSKGRERGVLSVGEQKMASSDRVALVPGPDEETRTVRWIFNQVAQHATTPTALANDLNSRHIPWVGGKAWDPQRILYMLGNEKYIGSLVYGKTSMRLHSPKSSNPRSEWVRVDHNHEPIVDPRVFRKAQAQMKTWTSRTSDKRALHMLKQLLAREGRLTSELIDRQPGMPGARFYRSRFGSLLNAYARIGYRPKRSYGYLNGLAERTRTLKAIRENAVGSLRARGISVKPISPASLELDGSTRLGICFGHYKRLKCGTRWLAQVSVQAAAPDWILAARLNEARSSIIDYCLVQAGVRVAWLGVGHRSGNLKEWYDKKLDSLIDRFAALLGDAAGA